MTFRLVDREWARELTDGLRRNAGGLRIVCPFIKARALDRLLSLRPDDVRVITRFNLGDFAKGASDIAALRKLLDAGATVRGIRNLHAKLYLFGTGRAVVTSANLTEAGLCRNHEFGAVTEDPAAVANCRAWFDDLWRRGGNDLRRDRVDEWDGQVTRCLASGYRPGGPTELDDFGADAGIAEPRAVRAPTVFTEPPQAFVKFFGRSGDRVPLSYSTVAMLKRDGCHWAATYPANKRPRQVKDGAAMFMAPLVEGPDIRIFGRAVGMTHWPERDDATPDDIARRPWKERWPHYIRVHSAEFVADAIGNGVSLNELMDALGTDSFASTQRNARRGEGNTDPRRAYMRHPAVELSKEGFEWLNGRLQAAFDKHGRLPRTVLDQLDWPDSLAA